MRRRDVLKVVGYGTAAAAVPLMLRDSRASATPRGRPRFYLQIIPQGGMDAVYSTDPKKVSEVETGIDIPFTADKIIETGAVRLGPSFATLAPWVPKLAIVNAFRQNSANHPSGMAHVLRCKNYSSPGAPSLLEILGARRDTQATAAINLGAAVTSAFSPTFLGQPSEYGFGPNPGLFDHLDSAEPDDLRTAAKALRREAAGVGGRRASAAEKQTADNLLQTAALFEGTASAPKLALAEWPHKLEGYYKGTRDIQRVLWLFENNLTRCVTLCVGYQDFDTHLWNTTVQPRVIDYLAFLLDKLFAELDRRVFDGKPLSQQTVVMIGSEIGRFPRLNQAHGKDHFAQVPHLFYGPWFATGAVHGGTGKNMASLPLSLASGKPEVGGHLLQVDDIGTTLLTLDGANPEHYGYAGEHLAFLVGG